MDETRYNDLLVGNRLMCRIAACDVKCLTSSHVRCPRTPRVRPAERIPVHDCRLPVIHSINDAHQWDAYLFSHAVRKTCDAARDLWKTSSAEEDNEHTDEPDKLLFTAGSRGSEQGKFRYPRALKITSCGDIYVADSMNHRIQVFTQTGLFRFLFGKRGSEPGEFDQPMGIALLHADSVVVADSGNKRIQLFSLQGRFKSFFPTTSEPYFIECDDSGYIVSSTMKRNIEIYNREGKLLRKFAIDNCEISGKMTPAKITLSGDNEIIVADITTGAVKCMDYDGILLFQFTPAASKTGLFCEPMAVSTNRYGEIIVADSLNRTVNMYNQRGDLLEELLKVSESPGMVQACAVSPEGHLVVLQFAANGEHCLKAFRYIPCLCHQYKPRSATGSSRMDYF